MRRARSVCLIDGKGRAPLRRARSVCLTVGKVRAPVDQGAPKGEWHNWELTDSTRGVAVSITGCRLRTGLPGFSFIGNPEGRPVPHASTLTLKQLNFLMQVSPQPGRFRN